MRTLFRPSLIIVIFAFALPMYASVQLGMGIGHTLQYIWVDESAQNPITVSGKSLYAQTERPLSKTTHIAFDVSWHTIQEAWVNPLMLLRGYDAIGLGCKVLVPLAKGQVTSFFLGPSVGLRYARYTLTPLAFAYAEAGFVCEWEIDVGGLFTYFSKRNHTDSTATLPLAVRLQIPWNVVFRKDIPFQTSIAARVVLLMEI